MARVCAYVRTTRRCRNPIRYRFLENNFVPWRIIFVADRACTGSVFYTVANSRNDGHIGQKERRDLEAMGGHTATILKDGASCKPCNLHPRKGKAVEKTRVTTTTHVPFPLAELSSPIGYHTTHGPRTPYRSLSDSTGWLRSTDYERDRYATTYGKKSNRNYDLVCN